MATQQETRLKSIREAVDGVEVGQTILYPRVVPISERVMARAMVFRMLQDRSTKPSSVAFHMHNNSAFEEFYPYPTERPASAYYTYDPKLDLVILEWGLIQNGEAKLHKYLNNVVNYTRRSLDEGMVVISGHVVKVKDGDFSFALLDCLRSGTLPPDYRGFRTVQILQQNRHLVVAANGEFLDPK